MNKSKLGRHLGIGRNYHGEFPPLSLSVPLDRLAGSEIRGLTGDALAGSQTWSVVVDPPVGGFALGDFLAAFPRSNPAGQITAPEAAQHDRFFAPGHFVVRQWAKAPAGTRLGYYTLLEIWNPATGAFNGPGGLSGPLWYFVQQSAADLVAISYENRVYMAQPWQMHLACYSALADGNVGYYMLSVEPIHLLDDNAGHQ